MLRTGGVAAGVIVVALGAAAATGRLAGPGDTAASFEKWAMERRAIVVAVQPTAVPLPNRMMEFFFAHPVFAAHLLDERGGGTYTVVSRGVGRLRIDDGRGTSGELEPTALGALRIYAGSGRHRGRVVPGLRAEVAIILTAAAVPSVGGYEKTLVTCRVAMHPTSPIVAAFATYLEPYARRVVLKKFSRAFQVADRLGAWLAQNPGPAVEEAEKEADFAAADRREWKEIISTSFGSPQR